MLIKKFFRKPLIIIIYAALLLVGSYCIVRIEGDIASTKAQYKDIYMNTKIECEVLSSIAIGDGYMLAYDILSPILRIDEIVEPYTEAYIGGKLHLDEDIEDQEISILASNDIKSLLSREGMNLVGDELAGITDENLLYISSDIAEKYSVSIGDQLNIYVEAKDFTKRKQSKVKLKTAGVLDLSKSKYGAELAVISNDIFFENEDFLYTRTLREQASYFNKFEFNINPKYNNEFEKVEEKIKNILTDEYTLHSTSREFYNVIKPLEDKIALQNNIHRALKISLILITSFICFLISKKEKEEILIRLMYGERKFNVFLSEFLSIIFLLILIHIAAYIVLNIIIGIKLNLLAEFLGINSLIIAINIALTVRKDILGLYQDWED